VSGSHLIQCAWRGVVLLGAMLTGAAAAAAQTCADSGAVRIAGSPGLALHDEYNPFAASDLTESVSIIVENRASETCDLAIVFTAPQGTGVLRSSNENLTYALETTSGAALLRPASIVDPTAGPHIALTLAAGESAAVSLRARIGAHQSVPPGHYADDTAGVSVYARPPAGSFGTFLDQRSFPVSVRVAAVCQMSAPSVSALDFSGDIGVDSTPRGAPRSVRLDTASCNTHARLNLSGSALTRDGAALAGFDSFVNFEARATFGSAAAMLVTSQDGASDETVPALVEDADVPRAIDVQIWLLARRALAAGTYSGVLTVTLEPSS